jgi:prevent-host-death family protein
MSASIWKLQDAKARFSEVVRRARSDGPQHVTVHGRDEAVVISASDYARLKEKAEPPKTGRALIEALSKLRGLEIERTSVRSPIRDVPDFNHPDFDR